MGKKFRGHPKIQQQKAPADIYRRGTSYLVRVRSEHGSIAKSFTDLKAACSWQRNTLVALERGEFLVRDGKLMSPAREWRWFDHNRASGVKLRPENNRRDVVFTKEAETRLIAACEKADKRGRLALLVRLGLATGARAGELTGLTARRARKSTDSSSPALAVCAALSRPRGERKSYSLLAPQPTLERPRYCGDRARVKALDRQALNA